MYLEDDFSDIVRKAMRGLNIDIETLSIETEISVERLSNLLTGNVRPVEREVTAISRALDLKGDRLWSVVSGTYRPEPLPPQIEERLIIIKGYIGGYEVRAYIVMDPEMKIKAPSSHPCRGEEIRPVYRKEGILVDTACNPGAIRKALFKRGITLKAILITHSHGDHVGGIDGLVSDLSLPVYGGEDIPGVEVRRIYDGETLSLGDMSIRCLRVPGHTEGSFAYHTGRLCFVGDTLFAGSIGRSNPPSLYQIHLRSIREKLLVLPDTTVLLPGHGPATTVGGERRGNPFL